MTDLIKRLRAIPGEDHVRGYEGRNYSCNCGRDETIDRIVVEAAVAITAAAEREKGLRAARDTLAAYETAVSILPCTRGKPFPKYCPRCGARPNQNCGPTVAALEEFLVTIRKALSAGEGE